MHSAVWQGAPGGLAAQAQWKAEEARRAAQEAAEVKQQRRLMEFKVW